MLSGSIDFKGIPILAGEKYKLGKKNKLEGPLLFWDSFKIGHTDSVAWRCQCPLLPLAQSMLLASLLAWASASKDPECFHEGQSSCFDAIRSWITSFI